MEDKQYQPHEQRVVDEKKELDEKIEKLSAFIQSNPIFEGLNQENKYLLQEQLQYMQHYSNILDLRIKLF